MAAGIAAADQVLVQACRANSRDNGGAADGAAADAGGRRFLAARRAAAGGSSRSRQVFQQVGHLDRHARGVAALVLGAPGLGQVSTVEDGVGDRQVVVQRDARDAGADSLATSSKW